MVPVVRAGLVTSKREASGPYAAVSRPAAE
ncbi:hypothetical protein SMD44_08737 [Streptomyces alboflavus]|uniref:Uncharacterized protein n=1 Tax=Streptomyces alboflavus TaxID=67267 RepID=A0A1Z1WS43_9ACTN|nr:hypothetical protein SMD44_08737 [Streptomyces alboflavus]